MFYAMFFLRLISGDCKKGRYPKEAEQKIKMILWDLFLVSSNKGRWNSLSFFVMKSSNFNDTVHFITFSHKSPCYMLQPNVTLILICF